MEAITRIKIRLGDNRCVIQPEVNSNCRETMNNSLSMNISKSEEENMEPNDNGEISMQSIFFSDKKTLTLSGIGMLNESHSTYHHLQQHQKDALAFKPDDTYTNSNSNNTDNNNNKPVLKQLHVSSKNTNPFSSVISLNKNPTGVSTKNSTVSTSKASSITSFKNASNINMMNTSPFNSNVINKSNSHSYSNTYIEKGTILNITKNGQAQGQGHKEKNSNNTNQIGSNCNGNNPAKRDYIETVITKILKQRSLSSRGLRPTTCLQPSNISNQLLHITQVNIKKKVIKSHSCIKNTLSSSKKTNSTQHQMGNEEKKLLQYSSSMSSLSSSILLHHTRRDRYKESNHTNSDKESNFSLLNYVIKTNLRKSSFNARAIKCQTSRSHINIPNELKRKASPKPSKISFQQQVNNKPNLIEVCTKKYETINNFSKYIRKSQKKKNELTDRAIKPQHKQQLSRQCNHPNMYFHNEEGLKLTNKQVFSNKTERNQHLH